MRAKYIRFLFALMLLQIDRFVKPGKHLYLGIGEIQPNARWV